MEEYLKLLSAVGLGAIIVKIIDIVWLQNLIQNNETKKWKRDKKIIAYSRLVNDLISQKEWGNIKRQNEIHELLGEVFLLIENQDLVTRVDSFYKEALKSLNISSGKRQEAEHYGDEKLIKDAIDFHKSENIRLQNEAYEILAFLKKDMIG